MICHTRSGTKQTLGTKKELNLTQPARNIEKSSSQPERIGDTEKFVSCSLVKFVRIDLGCFSEERILAKKSKSPLKWPKNHIKKKSKIPSYSLYFLHIFFVNNQKVIPKQFNFFSFHILVRSHFPNESLGWKFTVSNPSRVCILGFLCLVVF